MNDIEHSAHRVAKEYCLKSAAKRMQGSLVRTPMVPCIPVKLGRAVVSDAATIRLAIRGYRLPARTNS